MFCIPGAAKIAFDQCVQIEQIADKRGSYYQLVHYNYDYVEDFQNIFSDGGPKVSDPEDGQQKKLNNPHTQQQSYGNYSTPFAVEHNISYVGFFSNVLYLCVTDQGIFHKQLAFFLQSWCSVEADGHPSSFLPRDSQRTDSQERGQQR